MTSGGAGPPHRPPPGRRPEERFTDRVDDYLLARPGYPAAAAELVVRVGGLAGGDPAADVGAGTGLWSEQLLAAGLRVVALEPNHAMRRAGQHRLDHPRLAWAAGTAESTGLASGSQALVTAAQAFHWFEPASARREFARILRPGGRLALVWNDRRKASTPFLAAYEALLERWGTDYRQVDHTRLGRDDLASFFAPDRLREARFDNRQQLDLAGLEARVRSCSYVPPPGHPDHAAMMAAVARLFADHQRDGRVAIDYDTRVFHGELA